MKISKFVLGSETSDMTSEGLGEMFEGYSADTRAGKFPLVSMGGWSEGLACEDPGARTPIGASGNFFFIFLLVSSRYKNQLPRSALKVSVGWWVWVVVVGCGACGRVVLGQKRQHDFCLKQAYFINFKWIYM